MLREDAGDSKWETRKEDPLNDGEGNFQNINSVRSTEKPVHTGAGGWMAIRKMFPEEQE